MSVQQSTDKSHRWNVFSTLNKPGWRQGLADFCIYDRISRIASALTISRGWFRWL